MRLWLTEVRSQDHIHSTRDVQLAMALAHDLLNLKGVQ